MRRQDLLFAKMFKGSGKGGRWTLDDWDYYYDNRNDLWSGDTQWKNPDSLSGWDLFALHVERLATNYGDEQTEQFMRDFALVFGGISATEPWPQAAWDSRHGPTMPFIDEGNQGLDAFYLDSIDGPAANQSHHYAGILFLSYKIGPGPGSMVNQARDPDNPGDINLGAAAAKHAGRLITGSSIYDLCMWIDNLSP